VVQKGEFIEDCLGKKELDDVRRAPGGWVEGEGKHAVHARYGTYLLDDGTDDVIIRHLHGRKFLTTEQRERLGYRVDAGGGVRTLESMCTVGGAGRSIQ
jgi:hypothetical protein